MDATEVKKRGDAWERTLINGLALLVDKRAIDEVAEGIMTLSMHLIEHRRRDQISTHRTGYFDIQGPVQFKRDMESHPAQVQCSLHGSQNGKNAVMTKGRQDNDEIKLHSAETRRRESSGCSRLSTPLSTETVDLKMT